VPLYFLGTVEDHKPGSIHLYCGLSGFKELSFYTCHGKPLKRSRVVAPENRLGMLDAVEAVGGAGEGGGEGGEDLPGSGLVGLGVGWDPISIPSMQYAKQHKHLWREREKRFASTTFEVEP
jgi:hypothetical protein